MSFISKLQIRILNRKTNQNPSSSDENEQILWHLRCLKSQAIRNQSLSGPVVS